jgi:hypothetical protein
MTSPIGRPLVVNIPVNNDLVERAYELLKSRYIRRNTEDFKMIANTISHSVMDEYIQLLLEEYGSVDEEVKNYIRRLKFISEGTQVAKAIVTGRENRISVSVIVTSRMRSNTTDEHKILIASMEKTFNVRSNSSLLPHSLLLLASPFTVIAAILFPISVWYGLFDIANDRRTQEILRQLNDEENKQCLEAMAFHMLGEKIQSYMGESVQVRFIQS